jgi:hypothetical protein
VQRLDIVKKDFEAKMICVDNVEKQHNILLNYEYETLKKREEQKQQSQLAQVGGIRVQQVDQVT